MLDTEQHDFILGFCFFSSVFPHSHILHTLKNELIFTYSWANPNTPRESNSHNSTLTEDGNNSDVITNSWFFSFSITKWTHSSTKLLSLSFLVVLLAPSIPSVNEWSSMSLSYAHTHTKQTPHLTGVKVHALYDEEPGSLWVIIPASLCSHWSIFIPHPEHTHTQWCAMPLHWFHWFHCRDTLISIPTSDWNKDSKGT